MFKVNLAYTTKLGGLTAQMTTSQIVGSRKEADRVVSALKTMPWYSKVDISISNAPPLTGDEALRGFDQTLARFPIEEAR